MLFCFAKEAKNSIPIIIVTQSDYTNWLEKQNDFCKSWLETTKYKNTPGNFSLIPHTSGKLEKVLICVTDKNNFWGVGALPPILPEGIYSLEDNVEKDMTSTAIAWGLGAYQFTRYKKPLRKPAQLLLGKNDNIDYVNNIVESIYLVRDLINTPTDNMGPTELSAAAEEMAKKHQANFHQIIGDDLLAENYESIHMVGRASDDAPRLLDIRWGHKNHPKVTLVGKGVCFDTGGLDLKPASAMTLMKKDMAGGAHVLGLANMIMRAKLPICLRVLIPAVENSISGNAYRPGDIIKTRKGLTVEVGNTDAEGRLVLADALMEAVTETPELVIDIATLTGAARVALGTELPALFCNNDEVANDVLRHAEDSQDPMWRMPLFGLYRDSIGSPIADLNNNPTDSYGGAITAALFLKEFVPDTTPWIHFDLMAWNLKTRPGRPQGGEAMALRGLFSYLTKRFSLKGA